MKTETAVTPAPSDQPHPPIVDGFDFYSDDGGTWHAIPRQDSMKIAVISVMTMVGILAIVAIAQFVAKALP